MTTDDDPSWWSARRAARGIATRKISAREYLGVLTAEIERCNPALGPVVTRNERAYGEVAAADDAVARGESLPPLHGAAMTVKDCLATAGPRTTGGETALRSHIPRTDAAAVAALRRAGVIVAGKTNVPRRAGDVQTCNDLFGTARNPWHRGISTGGSSGGAAGAVAAGFTPVEACSDVAGSIRIPAACCWVSGHRPATGVVPAHGLVPPSPFHGGQESAEDRVAVGEFDAGRGDPPDLAGVQQDQPPGLLVPGMRAAHDVGQNLQAARVPGRRAHHREYASQSHQEWLTANESRARLRGKWKAFFTDFDALLLPAVPSTAPAHDHRPPAERAITVNGAERPYRDQVTWAGVTSMCHLPSTVVPARLDARGVPVGIAVAGPRLGDRTAPAAARFLERLPPPLGRPPHDEADPEPAPATARGSS